jgi:hypothetical protein
MSWTKRSRLNKVKIMEEKTPDIVEQKPPADQCSKSSGAQTLWTGIAVGVGVGAALGVALHSAAMGGRPRSRHRRRLCRLKAMPVSG